MRYFDLHGIFYNNPNLNPEPFNMQHPLFMLPKLNIDMVRKEIFILESSAKILNMKSPFQWNIAPMGSPYLPLYTMTLIITRLLKQVMDGKVALDWYKQYQDYYESQDLINKFGPPISFFKQIFGTSFYGQKPTFKPSFDPRDTYSEDPYICGILEMSTNYSKGYQETKDAFDNTWKIFSGVFASGLCFTADLPQYSDPSDKGDSVGRCQICFENLIPLCDQQIDKNFGGLFNFQTFDIDTMDESQRSYNETTQPDVPPITPI